ncbi:E22 family MetX-like putative esterase [Planctobacterium marinum]|uniref:Probable acyltransferase n=1 Tax=Planctobacterium marinum TaxID=1631968 RepID=A0AA48KR77_9ALTE|nr:homoserine O-acetyltransferase [Planctobacterium marinum]
MNQLSFIKKISVLILCQLLFCQLAQASFLVEKQTLELESFNTTNGKTIPQVTLGWESYGELNADKSNAILITHYFTGNSHAAGKYTEDDVNPGYWDAIIGPGKAIDTNRYFVLSMDTLANVSAYSEQVVTTGPASINPATGKPWGLDFPVVTIRDFVNTQKALLDSLGITKLHAVIGPSMGSMQAIEWAVAYPDMVERMVSVIGVAQSDAWLVTGLQKWANPILSDPNWQNGDYYSSSAPLEGLTQSLAIITQEAMHPRIFNQLNPEHSALEQPPALDIRNNFKVVDWLYQAASKRATSMDANHILYLVRACQLFMAGHDGNLEKALNKVQAKSLFLPARGDLLLFPDMAKQAHKMLQSAGKSSQYTEITGDWGHLDGIYNVQQQADTLKQFLEQKV